MVGVVCPFFLSPAAAALLRGSCGLAPGRLAVRCSQQFPCVVLMLSALTCAWEPGSATSTWFIFGPEQLSFLALLGVFLLRNL